jgi:hypothetical protein
MIKTTTQRLAQMLSGKKSDTQTAATDTTAEPISSGNNAATSPSSPPKPAVAGTDAASIAQKLAEASNYESDMDMSETYRAAEITYANAMAIKAENFKNADALVAAIRTLERDLFMLNRFKSRNPRATYLSTVIEVIERKIAECKMVRAIRFPE